MPAHVCAHTDVTAAEVIIAVALVMHHDILRPEIVNAAALIFQFRERFRLSTLQLAIDVLWGCG